MYITGASSLDAHQIENVWQRLETLKSTALLPDRTYKVIQAASWLLFESPSPLFCYLFNMTVSHLACALIV